MSRAYFRATVKDQGRTIQNAKAHVYLHGTTTPVADLWDAETGGQNLVEILSNNQGEIQGWLDAPKTIDLYITDNDQQAFPVTTPTARLTWPAFTETVQALPPTQELALDANVIHTSGTETRTGILSADVRIAGPTMLDLSNARFGLTPTSPGSATANVTAWNTAVAEANTSGRLVRLPAGQFWFNAELTMANDANYLEIEGAGTQYSQMLFTELGSGKWALKPAASAFGQLRTGGFKLYGPSTSVTRGQHPALCNGMQAGVFHRMNDMHVYGFDKGIQLNDHCKMRDTLVGGNYYGLWWEGYIGDITMIGCTITSNNFASIGIQNQTNFVSVNAHGCHFGFSPYIFFFESGGATTNIFASCHFDTCSFEFIGDGLIRDDNSTPKKIMQDITFTASGCSWGDHTTYGLPGHTRSELTRIYAMRRVKSNGNGTFWVTDGTVPAIKTDVYEDCEWHNAKDDFAALNAAGLPMVSGASGNVQSCTGSMFDFGTDWSKGYFRLAQFDVGQGRVLSLRNSNYVRQWFNNEALAGVAVYGATANNVVPVAVRGIVDVYKGTNTVAAGNYCVPDYATGAGTADDYSTAAADEGSMPRKMLGVVHAATSPTLGTNYCQAELDIHQ